MSLASTAHFFDFGGAPWMLRVYSTFEDPRFPETVVERVAAYCIADDAPRGPRRLWSRDGSRLVPWGWRDEGAWPELDEVVRALLGATGVG